MTYTARTPEQLLFDEYKDFFFGYIMSLDRILTEDEFEMVEWYFDGRTPAAIGHSQGYEAHDQFLERINECFHVESAYPKLDLLKKGLEKLRARHHILANDLINLGGYKPERRSLAFLPVSYSIMSELRRSGITKKILSEMTDAEIKGYARSDKMVSKIKEYLRVSPPGTDPQ